MEEAADYGIDSPTIVAGLLLAGVAGIGLAAAVLTIGPGHAWVILFLFAAGIYFLPARAGMLFYSKAGKLRLRDEILGAIPWRHDEWVLDVGCGRGLLTIGAARLLTTGRAVGVDVWKPADLSGSCPHAALENARAERLAARVSVLGADARVLPFRGASFDVMVSNFVLHNLNPRAEREKAVGEILRVLKPGGRMVLSDFIFTDEVESALRSLGADDLRRVRSESQSSWLTTLLNFGKVRVFRVTGAEPRSEDSAVPFEERGTSVFT